VDESSSPRVQESSGDVSVPTRQPGILTNTWCAGTLVDAKSDPDFLSNTWGAVFSCEARQADVVSWPPPMPPDKPVEVDS